MVTLYLQCTAADLIAALDGTANVTRDEDDTPRLRSTRHVIVDGPISIWDPPPEYDDEGQVVSEGTDLGPHFNLYVREGHNELVALLENAVAAYRLEPPATPKRKLAGE